MYPLRLTVLPTTVRGRRVLPIQPRRGASRRPAAAHEGVRRAERSQPACGARVRARERRASGVPGPDSAERPDGADRAASISAPDRAGRGKDGELAT